MEYIVKDLWTNEIVGKYPTSEEAKRKGEKWEAQTGHDTEIMQAHSVTEDILRR